MAEIPPTEAAVRRAGTLAVLTIDGSAWQPAGKTWAADEACPRRVWEAVEPEEGTG